MEKPLTKRQQQAIATKNNILESAIKLFKEKDYEKVTIAEICKMANVSPGNFYNYYKSKEEVLTSEFVVFDAFAEEEFALREFSSSVEALKELFNCRTDALETFGPKIIAQINKIEFDGYNDYSITCAGIYNKNRFFHSHCVYLVNKAIEHGEIHSSWDAEDIVQTMLELYRGICYEWCLSKGAYDIRERVNRKIYYQLCFYKYPLPNSGY